MPKIQLYRRVKYAGDVFNELLKAEWDFEAAAAFVNNIPDADAVPVVHGRWIKGKKEKLYCDWEMNGWYDIPVRCSNCKYDATEYGTGETRFCPDCGAKMDGGK